MTAAGTAPARSGCRRGAGTSASPSSSPAPDRPIPSAATVAGELDALRRLGVERVVTSALHRHELGPFEDNGFVEQERLHLLRHDLIELPPLDPAVPIRRGWRRDRAEVLTLDERAFDDFWTLDRRGLDDAIRATPASRFRVVRLDRRIVGYSVTGMAGSRGYLQRLAVDPDDHGRGLGRALVAESLRWLQRSGARHTLVNTQFENERALHLYRSCGFVAEPDWLTVLARPRRSWSALGDREPSASRDRPHRSTPRPRARAARPDHAPLRRAPPGPTATRPHTTSTGPSVTTTTEAPGTAAADLASLRVVSQPAAVDPDGRFTVTLEVRGAAGGDVVVDIYDRVTDRIGLIESQTGSLANSRATFEPIPLEDRAGPQRITFTIYLHDRGQPAPDGAGYWARQLTEPGAYPVKIRLRDASEEELASAVTYLVRRPSPRRHHARRPRSPCCLILDRAPARRAESDLDLDRANQVVDALADHPDLPVTLTVDPDLLDRMTRPDGAAPPDPEEVAFVDDLDRITGRDDAEVLGAPFTDVDPAQLTTVGLGNSLADQARLGAEVNDDLLGTAGTTTWWVPHRLDAASAFGLRVAGVEHLVLAPSSLIGAAPLVPTPLVDLDPAFTVVSTASDLPRSATPPTRSSPPNAGSVRSSPTPPSPAGPAAPPSPACPPSRSTSTPSTAS